MLPLLLMAAAASSGSCPIERAHYALRADRSITAEFHPTQRNDDWPAGITFAVHVAKTAHNYWWLPWNGGTDGRQNIRLTRLRKGASSPLEMGPHADLEFWTTDSSYRFLDGVPKAGGAAPAHIFVPLLNRALFYYSMPEGNADNVPRAFFDLVSCGKANAPVDVELWPVA